MIEGLQAYGHLMLADDDFSDRLMSDRGEQQSRIPACRNITIQRGVICAHPKVQVIVHTQSTIPAFLTSGPDWSIFLSLIADSPP